MTTKLWSGGRPSRLLTSSRERICLISGHLRHRHDAAGVGVKISFGTRPDEPLSGVFPASQVVDLLGERRGNPPLASRNPAHERGVHLERGSGLRLTAIELGGDELRKEVHCALVDNATTAMVASGCLDVNSSLSYTCKLAVSLHETHPNHG